MSTLKVDSITDAAGTGPVDFPQGLSGATLGVADGSSAAAGEVGEIISASITTNTSTATADTAVDIAGASLTLTAGRWVLYYALNVTFDRVATTGNIGARIHCTDASNVLVATSTAFQLQHALAAEDWSMFLNHQFFLNIATGATYKLRLTSNQSSGAGIAQVRATSAGFLTGTERESSFYALRIA